MRKLIIASMLASTLVGCVSYTPPATQVALPQPASQSEPAVVGKVCEVASIQSGKPKRVLDKPVIIRDMGSYFEAYNANGVKVFVSPTLGAPVNDIESATDSIGLVYSKGINKYSGFYSRTAVLSKINYWSVLITCK